MIVDDSPTETHVLKTMLEGNGFLTLMASDGRQAIDVCRKEKPDLVLMDVVMPGINGFQATRELLNNIVKHAQAAHVDISITRRNGHVQIEVSDDGIGFDPSTIAPPSKESGRFGLFNIRERLGGLNGSMEIDSHPRRGTRITLRAPLDLTET